MYAQFQLSFIRTLSVLFFKFPNELVHSQWFRNIGS